MSGKTLRLWLAVITLLTMSLIVAGCGAMKKAPMAKAGMAEFNCAGSGVLEQNVTPAAKVVKFKCFFKKYKGVKSLWFDVKLKNVSSKPQRFRVNIFLAEGKAVGGLIPRKTKKGLVKPGAVAGFKYPIKGMGVKSKGVTLIVKTIGG